MAHPLKEIRNAWLEKIQAGREHKWKEFSCYAQQIRQFYDQPHDKLYSDDGDGANMGFVRSRGIGRPPFGMTVNRTAECAELLIPAIAHRNPVRRATVRDLAELPPSIWGPNAQMILMGEQQERDVKLARAALIEDMLNYTPNELHLGDHTRRMSLDMVLSGLGVLWQEVYQPIGSNVKLFGSFHESVQNIIYDPDHYTLDECLWVVRSKWLPKWEVEDQWGLPRGTIKGSRASASSASIAEREPKDYEGPWRRRSAKTNDLIEVFEVYSKMGIGTRLKDSYNLQALEEIGLDELGPHAFLVLCHEYEYPLNLQPKVLKQFEDPEELLPAIDWPTPFYADQAGWPFVELAPYKRPDSPYPFSLLLPVLGHQKAIDWICSFILQKVRVTCNDTVLVAKGFVKKLKDEFGRSDLTVLEVERLDRAMGELVHVLQFPPMQTDIFKAYEIFDTNFRDGSGMTELAMGRTSTQMRSAAEADIKQQNASIRPDDIAKQMEEAQGRAARQEAIGMRWHLKGQDVAPVMGRARAMLWDQLMVGATMEEIVREIDYRVESNSMRRPDKQRDVENANESMQILMPALMQAASTWNPANVQTAVQPLVDHWTKSRDMGRIVLQPPLPPPPPPMPGQGPPPGPGPEGEGPPGAGGPPPADGTSQAAPPVPGGVPPAMPPGPMPELPPEFAAALGMVPGMAPVDPMLQPPIPL